MSASTDEAPPVNPIGGPFEAVVPASTAHPIRSRTPTAMLRNAICACCVLRVIAGSFSMQTFGGGPPSSRPLLLTYTNCDPGVQSIEKLAQGFLTQSHAAVAPAVVHEAAGLNAPREGVVSKIGFRFLQSNARR